MSRTTQLASVLALAALAATSCTGGGGSDDPDAGWRPPIPSTRRDAGAPSTEDGEAGTSPGHDAAVDGGAPPTPDASTQAVTCAPNPCEHGGTCTEQAGATACSCPATWTGARCETDVDECAAANVCNAPAYPCQNFAGGYACVGQMADWPVPKRRFDNSSFAEQKLVVDAASGTLLDEVTGLMWQQNLPTGNAPGFDAAKQACSDYTAGGHDDWRLPSMIELMSFQSTERAPQFPQGLLSRVPACLWSVSPNLDGTGLMTAEMGTPYQYSRTRDDATCSFMCVRTHEAMVSGRPAERYDLTNPDLAVDRRTGLTWEKRAPLTPYTYADAEARCSQLSLAGLRWRLPTFLELLSTHDFARSAPTAGFVLEGPPLQFWTPFWSSTRLSSRDAHLQVTGFAPVWHWGISGDGSPIAVGEEPSPVYVRCVHE